MICPACNKEKTEVTASRAEQGVPSVRRERTCKTCQYRFYTHEKPDIINPETIKKKYERNKRPGWIQDSDSTWTCAGKSQTKLQDDQSEKRKKDLEKKREDLLKF